MVKVEVIVIATVVLEDDCRDPDGRGMFAHHAVMATMLKLNFQPL